MRMPCEFFSLLSSNFRNCLSVPAKLDSFFREGRTFQGILDATEGSDFVCYLETACTICVG